LVNQTSNNLRSFTDCLVHNNQKYCSDSCQFRVLEESDENMQQTDKYEKNEHTDTGQGKQHDRKLNAKKQEKEQPAESSANSNEVAEKEDNKVKEKNDPGKAESNGTKNKTEKEENTDEIQFSIFHTNDIHGKLNEKNGQGGLVNLSGKINQLREETSDFILVDAGDISYNPPYSNRNRFNPIPEAMNEIGYDVLVTGNHEYQWEAKAHGGPEGNPNPDLVDNLKELSETLEFPVVNANAVREDSGEIPDYVEPYVIEQVGDVNVGIVGICTQKMATDAHPDVADNWIIKDPASTLSKIVPEMKENGADIIVGVGHVSLGRNREIIKRVPGIDMMIGAHDHETTPVGELREEMEHTDKDKSSLDLITNPDGREVPLVQAGSHTKLVGELEITVDPSTKEITSIESIMHPTVGAKDKADPDIVEIVNEWEKK
jgi:5'-nucleotidase / UDP-sugar diphosphatase